ncbi:hypothetical protein [Streptomyces sp. NPDC001492]
MMPTPQYETAAAPAGCLWDPWIPTTSHGGGYVWPGRMVLNVPGRTWPHLPADCPRPETAPGEWIGEGTPAETLVCPGCGLDCT